MARPHYPRMMFHRSKPPVTVHSWAEEYALGAEWRRSVWPAALGGGSPAAVPAPVPPPASAVPEPDAAPGGSGDDPPGAPHPTQDPGRPDLTYNKRINSALDPEKYKLGTGEPILPKRQRAPTVKPTGKPKKKSRDW